jgi:hypothetical protein
VDRDRKDGRLACEFRIRIVLGKVRLDILGFARAHADDSRREAGDETLLEDLGRLILRFAAIEGDAVDLAFVIDRRNVTERDRAVDGNEGAAVFAQLFERVLDIRVRHGRGGTLELDPLVVAEFDLRPNRNRRANANGLTLFFGQQLHLR